MQKNGGRTMSKCIDCKYGLLSRCEAPCRYCRQIAERGSLSFFGKIDFFEPKEVIEHDGCNGCVYEHLSEFEEPCVSCKGRYKQDTMAYLKAKDCFKPKEKEHSSNCTISVKECNKAFKNEDYGFKEISKDEIDMVNHPPHYVGHGIEPIEFIESHNLNFNLGSAVKYIARAPYKGTELLDLKKAKWFIEREIKRHDK